MKSADSEVWSSSLSLVKPGCDPSTNHAGPAPCERNTTGSMAAVHRLFSRKYQKTEIFQVINKAISQIWHCVFNIRRMISENNIADQTLLLAIKSYSTYQNSK